MLSIYMSLKTCMKGEVTSVRSPRGYTNEFPITVFLHQGSALSPYLFTLVTDELTGYIQDDIPWYMLFADDVVLVDKTSKETKPQAISMGEHLRK